MAAAGSCPDNERDHIVLGSIEMNLRHHHPALLRACRIKAILRQRVGQPKGPKYGCVRSTACDPLRYLPPLSPTAHLSTEIGLAHCAGLVRWIRRIFVLSRTAAASRLETALTRSHKKSFVGLRMSLKQ
jgi:hypothetical protein